MCEWLDHIWAGLVSHLDDLEVTLPAPVISQSAQSSLVNTNKFSYHLHLSQDWWCLSQTEMNFSIQIFYQFLDKDVRFVTSSWLYILQLEEIRFVETREGERRTEIGDVIQK